MRSPERSRVAALAAILSAWAGLHGPALPETMQVPSHLNFLARARGGDGRGRRRRPRKKIRRRMRLVARGANSLAEYDHAVGDWLRAGRVGARPQR